MPRSRHDGRMGRRLTETEAMLWNLEQNPKLVSTMGAVAMLGSNPEQERFENTIAGAVLQVPALREKVRPSGLPMVPPEWVTDRHFDLSAHVRWRRLVGGTGDAALAELVAQIINDPFDRTRPLWQLTVITGLAKKKAALVIKLHHSIADGAGALALATSLLDFTADAPERGAVDVATGLALLMAAEAEEPAPDPASALADLIRGGAEKMVGLLNDAASGGGETLATARSLAEQMPNRQPQSSPHWRDRSRNRRAVFLDVPLDDLKTRAAELEVSLNDLFVAACAEAAIRQHQRAGVELDTLSSSVVISTRQSDDPAAQNAVLPTSIHIPVSGAGAMDRLLSIRAQVVERREQVSGSNDLLGALGALSGLLPSAVTSSLAADQAARVDFATSNLPGPPIPVWIAGSQLESLRPIGPVGGTAFNATLLSYLGQASIGLHVDPACIPDPASLKRDLRQGFTTLGV